MKTDELLHQLNRLIDRFDAGFGEKDDDGFKIPYLQAVELLRTYAPDGSVFYSSLAGLNIMYPDLTAKSASAILKSFREYIQEGLHSGVTPERSGQLDVVTDLLDQSNTLLENTDVHPAASAVLIGATLEEFLRTWVAVSQLEDEQTSRSLSAYASVLRTGGLITKQEAKDIQAWSGLRNSAAHGQWEEVENRQQIRLMLEGVNLFISKHDPRSA